MSWTTRLTSCLVAALLGVFLGSVYAAASRPSVSKTKADKPSKVKHKASKGDRRSAGKARKGK